VDLDPYGTAAPFVDPAIQCVKDGGERGVHRLARGLETHCVPFRFGLCYMHRPGGPRHKQLPREVAS
jgi:hypothetical protein